MIQLKPIPFNLFNCPACGAAKPGVNAIRFQTINILADCTCLACGISFLNTFPVGHTVARNISMIKGTEEVFTNDKNSDWLSDAFLKANLNNKSRPVQIKKVVNRACSEVVILNTLDSLYGHVLLKLYNAFYHLDQQQSIGLILIIPKLFEWLIPDGCAEVWIVDLKLSELVYSYEAVDKFVANESNRFTTIYLSNAYSHPDFSRIAIERLTRTAPFDLKKFNTQKSTVTFILREDRWWFSSSRYYWFYRLSRKVKILRWASKQLCRQQNRLVKRTIQAINQILPGVDFHVVGLGRTGRFIGYASDERKWRINEKVEQDWCTTYAKSHVVIGIHGSNMLLPTALAAGCVEILPEDRYGNMVQDISVRYNNRLQLFFYRFADQFSSPSSVAKKVTAIIKDYEAYHKNMCEQVYYD